MLPPQIVSAEVAGTMSERGRERLYWIVSLAVLAVACANLPRLARVPWPFGEYSSRLLLAGAVLGLVPLTLVVHLVLEAAGRALVLRSPLPRMLFRNPAGQFENSVAMPPERVQELVSDRLERLGFSTAAGPDIEGGAVVLRGSKPSVPQCQSFLDNAFDATVRLTPQAGGRTAIEASVTEQVLIAIETGEREKLRELAAYLALAREELDVAAVSLITYVALVGAWAGVLGAALLPDSSAVQGAALSAALLGAVAYAVFAAVAIVRGRQQLFGLRLVAMTLLLALLPFGARATRDFAHVNVARLRLEHVWLGVLIVLMLGTMSFGEIRARRLAAAGRAGGPVRQGLRRVSWWGAAFGLSVLGMGVGIWLDARRVGDRAAVTARELEQGLEPPSRLLRVEGWLDISRGRWTGSRSGTRTHLIPVVSEPGREPVAALLRVKGDDTLDALRGGDPFVEVVEGSFDGLVYGFGIGEEERAEFAQNDIPLAAHCLLIEAGLTQEVYVKRARPPIAIGAGTLAAIGLLQVLIRVTDRRALPAAAESRQF